MSEEFSPTIPTDPTDASESLPDPEGIGALTLSEPAPTPHVGEREQTVTNTAPRGEKPTLSSAQHILREVASVTESFGAEAIPYGTAPLVSSAPRAGRSIVLSDDVLKSPTLSVKIEDELEEAQRIRNKDALQDVFLKRVTLILLFLFLAMETTAVFAFAFFQATTWFGFHLEEWSFNLLMTATILQITYMIQVAVRYLFNGKE